MLHIMWYYIIEGGWFIPEVWMRPSFFRDTGLGWGGSLCAMVRKVNQGHGVFVLIESSVYRYICICSRGNRIGDVKIFINYSNYFVTMCNVTLFNIY